uniref:Uncharacterized protein n=2 Tax=Physcomitrium patens TaxID=3218 RepID=A0A2K1JPQ2_PHYPA|nr:hypothetical protein PHYPA_015906 [Physcomitrium patens]
MQETNLNKREMEEQVGDFNGKTNFLQMKEIGSYIKGGEGEKKDSFQTITMEGQGIQKFEGNAKIKNLETNDNAVGSYGYSILNKFVQVDDGNLGEKSLGDKKVFSTFEGREDVLPNTLDYVEEFKVKPLQKMDYGSIEGYNHKDSMNS